jgi:hypothetical protein
MRSVYKTEFFPAIRESRRKNSSNLVLAYSSKLPHREANTPDVCNYIATLCQELEGIAKAIGHEDLACTLMVVKIAAGVEVPGRLPDELSVQNWTT